MENTLQNIHAQFVSIPEDEIQSNNQTLHAIIDVMKERMKQVDELFKELSVDLFYGGSFYDGLKVGKPDEFDIDILLKLPDYVGIDVNCTDPGYVQLKCYINDRLSRPKCINRILTNDYLDPKKVLHWMQSVIDSTLQGFLRSNDGYLLDTPFGQRLVNVSTNTDTGPAFTLQVHGYGDHYLSIDFVPCFVLEQRNWPLTRFRSNPVPEKATFFAVPKLPKKKKRISYIKRNYNFASQLPQRHQKVNNLNWRLSFQRQERVLICHKSHLKSAVRLLKKLIDTLNLKNQIVSYYIKNLALLRLEKEDDDFWGTSLKDVFLTLLKDLEKCLKNELMPYFWCKSFDLFTNISSKTLQNIHGRISNILEDLTIHPDDPEIITKYLLTDTEKDEFGNFCDVM